ISSKALAAFCHFSVDFQLNNGSHWYSYVNWGNVWAADSATAQGQEPDPTRIGRPGVGAVESRGRTRLRRDVPEQDRERPDAAALDGRHPPTGPGIGDRQRRIAGPGRQGPTRPGPGTEGERRRPDLFPLGPEPEPVGRRLAEAAGVPQTPEEK